MIIVAYSRFQSTNFHYFTRIILQAVCEYVGEIVWNKAMLCMLCFYFTRVLTCPRHSVESAINECIWFRLLASISLSMTHSFSILRTHVLSKAFLYSCSSIIILLSRSSLVIEPVGMFVKYKKSFIFVFLVAYTVIKFSTSVHFEADL